MAAIECIDLTKTYSRKIKALHEVTLSIPKGASFGLLGENGAGKSTLVRILMGFIFPSSGKVSVLGEENVTHVHSRIGYVHERPIFEHRFTGRDYLRYLGQLSGLWEQTNGSHIDQLLEMVNLQAAANRMIGTYSKGMTQRLAIAQALLTEPELLILDEPTSSLDPHSQWEVRQIVIGLRDQGKTILICSHDLNEIRTLCESVGILRKGRLVLNGNVSDLLHSQGIIEIVLADHLSAQEVIHRLQMNDLISTTQNNLLRIREDRQHEVLSRLLAANISIHSLNPVSRTLEEVFLQTVQEDHKQEHITPLATSGSNRQEGPHE